MIKKTNIKYTRIKKIKIKNYHLCWYYCIGMSDRKKACGAHLIEFGHLVEAHLHRVGGEHGHSLHIQVQRPVEVAAHTPDTCQ